MYRRTRTFFKIPNTYLTAEIGRRNGHERSDTSTVEWAL